MYKNFLNKNCFQYPKVCTAIAKMKKIEYKCILKQLNFKFTDKTPQDGVSFLNRIA